MSERPVYKKERRARPPWANLHLWQIQSVRDLMLVAGLFGLLLLGKKLSLVTVPLLLSLLVAYLVEPLVQRATRLSWVSRRLAAGAMTVLGVVLVIGPTLVGASFALLQGIQFASKIADRTEAVIQSVDKPADEGLTAELGEGAWRDIRDLFVDLKNDAQLLQRVEQGNATAEELEASRSASVLGVDSRDLLSGADLTIRWVRENATQIGRQALTTGKGALTMAVSTVTSIGKFFFGAFLTAFFFFFVCSGWPDVVEFGQGTIPEEYRTRAAAILSKMDRAIHGFIRGRLTIGFLLGIFYTIGFWVIGVPAPLLLGPIVAVITLIPYAALLAIPVVMVLMWLEGNTGVRGGFWWILIAPFVLYQIGQILDDYVLTPAIQGQSTDLMTPAILFASVAGGVLLGVFGLLAAIPLAACIKILWNEIFWPRLKAWTEGRAPDPLPFDDESL
ncbi:MAG: AI-2E family transporter [Planctomycetota bacterium]